MCNSCPSHSTAERAASTPRSGRFGIRLEASAAHVRAAFPSNHREIIHCFSAWSKFICSLLLFAPPQCNFSFKKQEQQQQQRNLTEILAKEHILNIYAMTCHLHFPQAKHYSSPVFMHLLRSVLCVSQRGNLHCAHLKEPLIPIEMKDRKFNREVPSGPKVKSF